MRRSILLVSELVLAFCVARTTAAQVLTLAPGTRIRLSTAGPHSKQLAGVIDSVSGGVVTMKVGVSPMLTATIPVTQVTRLEVLRGAKRPTWSKTAPLWLPVAAGGFGAMLAYATSSDDPFFGRGFAAAAGGVLGGALGLLVGTGLAIGVKEEQWERVPFGATTARKSVAPSWYVAPQGSGGGVTLGMRATF